MGENVLVTGGAGYIGSHTCKALAEAGFTPVTYDNLSCGHEWAVKWGPLECGDILETEHLHEVLERYRPAAVIHFAAFAYVGESVTDPAKYYRNNVVGTLSLLEAMRKAKVQNIVFSSTCATYGIPNTVPITETEAQKPINPYGTSKLMVEQILADYRAAYDLNSVALRYFNAAGADPEGEIGEAHDPETHLIPLVLDTARGKRSHITIFGEDYDTEDGSCIRDYIHVRDLARAHVQAMERLPTGKLRPAYNLGTGRGYSVKDVIAAARRATNQAIRVELGVRRPGDPARLVADATSAQKDLDWTPVLTDIEEIIATAWRWAQKAPRTASVP